MAIYTRFGSPIRLVRPVTTTAEVEKLDMRSSDQHDLERLSYGMYAVGVIEGDDHAIERLVDLGMLKADGGIVEINAAAVAVGCEPK